MKILTFDVEDWFHILDHPQTREIRQWTKFESRLEAGLERILNALDAKSQRATFFCLGWVAEKHPNLIRKIDNAGHEIGSHSYAHQLVYEQNPAEFRRDVEKSIDTLQQVIGKKISTYRAPGFSITGQTLWAFEILSEVGVDVDCSIFPAQRAHGGMRGFDFEGPAVVASGTFALKCLPINTARSIFGNFVYSGGGYFRLLPLSFLRFRFDNDPYIMTYFHPRDFDPDQPTLGGLSPVRQFKSYVGLSASICKLEALLSDYLFMTVAEAVDATDWSMQPIIRINV